MVKTMIAAAGLSLGVLMLPVAAVPARADVDIDINIGGKDKISCHRGKRIVEDYGFRHVQRRDCSGRRYTYFGRRHGDDFIITVDSRRARIVDIDEID
ncbi:MAG: hypothetical protein AB7S92_26410 [Parvibaculaceae bacterium]